MIELKDVRVGNWLMLDNERVWSNKYNKTNQQVTIDTLNEISSNENYYSPITLTAEILEKCQFGYVNEAGGYANDNHFVDEWLVDEHYFLFHPFCTNDKDCHIKIIYLHQLQNLIYILNNKELEIVW